MEKVVEKVVAFWRLRDVWNAKYRMRFRNLAKTLGYSNDYISSLGGVMGFCGETPTFVLLVNNGRRCKFGTAIPPIFKNGRKYCRIVFFEKAKNIGVEYNKDILKKVKLFLKENGFYGVSVFGKNELAQVRQLAEIGFKRIVLENRL